MTNRVREKAHWRAPVSPSTFVTEISCCSYMMAFSVHLNASPVILRALGTLSGGDSQLCSLNSSSRIEKVAFARPSRNARTEAEKRGSLMVRGFFGIGGKGKTAIKNCGKCKGKGSIECPGCKGSGKNKKNGNVFERWKCYDCQGFGLVQCPSCGKGGLTPEQRGER